MVEALTENERGPRSPAVHWQQEPIPAPGAAYVCRRTPEWFEIARLETGGKPHRIRVGYRIVARRADVKSARLPVVRMPAEPAVPARATSQRKASARKPGVSPTELKPLPSAPKTPLIRTVD